MTTTVIGATGRVGREIVRGVLARGDAVAALVRNSDNYGHGDRIFTSPILTTMIDNSVDWLLGARPE